MKKLRFHLLFLLTALVCVVQANDLPVDEAWKTQAEKQLDQWQFDLDEWNEEPPTLTTLEKRQNEVFSLRQEADDCVSEYTSLFDSQQEKLKALGEKSDDESAELKRRRDELTKQQQLIDADLAVCRLLSLGLRELQAEHKIIRSKLLSKALSHRDDAIWLTAFSLLKNPDIFATDFSFKFSFWPAALGGFLLFLVLMPMSRYVADQLRQKFTDHRVISMLARRLPWLAALVSLALFTYMGEAGFITTILIALVISLLLAPALELLLCQDEPVCRAGLPARILFDIVLVGGVAYVAGLQQIVTPETLKLIQAGYFLLLMLVSLWLLYLLSKREAFQLLNTLRTPVALAMVAGPVSFWIGYQSLAEMLIFGIYGTLAGFLASWMLLKAGGLFFSMFEPSTPHTNPELREFLGYQNDELVPGLWIGRLLLLLAVIGGFLYWLLIAWRVPHSDINTISSYINDGFPVGAITIVPSKIIAAVLVFFLLLTLVRWLKNQLSERWLQGTRLDAGARESIVSLTTYAIVGIALMIALGMAGVDFQNVAIVAGALSVGIGFGLQNIVNNFVSGLILLFERPVKPGDWVVVGTTEGYVKKISIRFTLIQTFDRADVMVPNSELISSQVTNWMLRDSLGRVIVPVGVAYGSDVQKVREILNKVAVNHPLVLVNDWRVPGPKVIFMAFGDSSLNFELRCFIKEIDYRLSVRSDLLFAIDEEFRKAGIEIPFPQRVVHMADKEDEEADDNQNPQDKP